MSGSPHGGEIVAFMVHGQFRDEPADTLMTLRRLAAHVLGRRRFERTGRFGLRAFPGGIATPAFGPEPEVLRLAGTTLVREVGGASSSLAVTGSTLAELARFAGTDLRGPFSCGNDTPEVGDVDGPLFLDTDAFAVMADWYWVGWTALDRVLASLPATAEPATPQLWPEHLDVGTNVAMASGARVNLGFSPGDGFEPGPYAYVGPWEAERPGDAAYWNAPFGAVLRLADLFGAPDRVAAGAEFLLTGLQLLEEA